MLDMDYKFYLIFLYTLQVVHSRPLQQKIAVSSVCSGPFLQAGKQIVDCVIREGELLDYRELRDWTATFDPQERLHVSLECFGGAVFLPWPYRASNVVSLQVHDCEVQGMFSEWNLTNNIPDQLQQLEMTDIVIQTDIKEMYERLMNIANYTSDFECSQRTLEYDLTRNVRHHFDITMDDMNFYQQIMLQDPNKLFIQNRPKNYKCVYPNLRYLENSGNYNMAKLHFKILEDRSEYPELEVYDLSNNSFTQIPTELRNIDFRLFPNLKRINFSKNKIKDISLKFPRTKSAHDLIVIDLSENRIKHIPLMIVGELTRNQNVIIDLRANPLRCDCSLLPFRRYLAIQFAKHRFDLFRDVTCQRNNQVFRVLNRNFESEFCQL